jgi:hypothetical protein
VLSRTGLLEFLLGLLDRAPDLLGVDVRRQLDAYAVLERIGGWAGTATAMVATGIAGAVAALAALAADAGTPALAGRRSGLRAGDLHAVLADVDLVAAALVRALHADRRLRLGGRLGRGLRPLLGRGGLSQCLPTRC